MGGGDVSESWELAVKRDVCAMFGFWKEEVVDLALFSVREEGC